ncbi:MAG: alpha/beta hydrolase [Bacteriovoracaceae bacterium]|nr:alpha/beta hydrolase [Bacteriovoracaceae bacterium]
MFADLSSYDGACFYLKEKFQVLRYDCRGQGKSPKPLGIYHLKDHVLDLANLLNDKKLGKIILVGLSNGARIAMEYARLFPENVVGVCACDCFDIPTPMIKAKLGSWLMAHEVGGALHRFDVATPWIWGEDVFNEKSELFLSYREKAGSLPDHVVKGLLKGAMETDIDVSELSCPVLFVAGREDLLTPPFLHEKMSSRAKKGEFKMSEGGHAGLIERPAIMEKQILPWIESLQEKLRENLK